MNVFTRLTYLWSSMVLKEKVKFDSKDISNDLYRSVWKSFISSVKSIPKYFILFSAIVSGTVFLISFEDCSSLLYRNATDFYTLILYPAPLLECIAVIFTYIRTVQGNVIFTITCVFFKRKISCLYLPTYLILPVLFHLLCNSFQLM